MDGLLTLAWRIFLFIMLITSWRELVKIGVKLIAWTSGFITGILTYIGDHIAWFTDNRRG